jgi:hypothetical protein
LDAAAPTPQKRTRIDDDFIAELQTEYLEVDVTALAADYLNWSGSKKHIDKRAGLRNQLRMEWKREQFRIRDPLPPKNHYSQLAADELPAPTLPDDDEIAELRRHYAGRERLGRKVVAG